jgi:phosphoribosylcarboxyaminoimidazole (NCAIR) mutase
MEPEKLLQQGETPKPVIGVPSPKAQSWGVIISIVIIVLMIVVGAFYAWGERISEENALLAPTTE